jgi:hypothetical protein
MLQNRFDLAATIQKRFGYREPRRENQFERLFARQQRGPLLGIFLQLDFISLHR